MYFRDTISLVVNYFVQIVLKCFEISAWQCLLQNEAGVCTLLNRNKN
jgi:hypothetical protein